MDYVLVIGVLCGAWAILRLMAGERQDQMIRLQEAIDAEAEAAAEAAAFKAAAEAAAKQAATPVAKPAPKFGSVEPLVRRPVDEPDVRHPTEAVYYVAK